LLARPVDRRRRTSLWQRSASRRLEEARRLVEEYAADLRDIIKKLRRHLKEAASVGGLFHRGAMSERADIPKHLGGEVVDQIHG
jgi:hypothetical protein